MFVFGGKIFSIFEQACIRNAKNGALTTLPPANYKQMTIQTTVVVIGSLRVKQRYKCLFLKYKPKHSISYKIACVLCEDSNQRECPHSQSRVFACHSVGSQEPKASSGGQRRLIRLRGCSRDFREKLIRTFAPNPNPPSLHLPIRYFMPFVN